MALCANDTAMLDSEPDTDGFPLKVFAAEAGLCLARPHKYGSFQFKLQLKGGQRVPRFVPNKAEQNGGSGVGDAKAMGRF